MKDVFDDDVPIVQQEDQDIMSWQKNPMDKTVHVSVEIWDEPLHEIFRLTANKLREHLEKDLEHSEEKILQDLKEEYVATLSNLLKNCGLLGREGQVRIIRRTPKLQLMFFLSWYFQYDSLL